MKAESAANAACVREEIVCVSLHFYQSHHPALGMYLTRAQAAFAAVRRGERFVGSATFRRFGAAGFPIPQQYVTGNLP